MVAKSSTEKIGFEHRGIGDALRLNRLIVPLNQREYKWQDEHVRDLYQDLADAIAAGRPHFLGTIVLTRGSSETPEVSDGQQRLATTTILIAAIRDYLFRNNDRTRAKIIEAEYLTTQDLVTTESVPRLRLNVDDNEFFSKFILASPDSPDRAILPTKTSHKLIHGAAKLAKQYVDDILKPYADQTKTTRLLEWIEFIRDSALVILLRVPDYLNAFKMFETLNDRGLKASQADLLKNHLLNHAGDRQQEAQHKWAKMIGVLETLDLDDDAVTYLHHFIITQDGPTKARDVFDKVQASVNSQAQALQFLDEIAEGSTDYAALFNQDHVKWNRYGTTTRKHISTINLHLRVEQIRPLMFAVSRYFSVSEGIKAFRLFVNWSVRFLVVGGRGGLLDRNYALRAQAIGTGRIKTARELADAMSDVVPSDAVFEASFSEARISQSHLARYFLRALELARRGEAEPELVPTDEEQAVNLEHILPQNPQGRWPNVDEDTAEVYYRRIGNMAIIQARMNTLIGNSSFAEKREVLKDSAFILTSEVAKYDTWGAKEINERQSELAKLAVATWPIAV